MNFQFIQTIFFLFTASFPNGSVSIDDGNMTHFVAEDLEYKIKIASPVSTNDKGKIKLKTTLCRQK